MKWTILLSLSLSMSVSLCVAQTSTSSAVEVIKVYLQNGKFVLESVPFDNISPSLRGRTFVYEKGKAKPMYVFDKGFDEPPILSNNGEVIFYTINWEADEEKEELKSVTIYRKGVIVKSYTQEEVTRCDERKERCSLIYQNFSEVVDKEKSNLGTPAFAKVFKEGVSEKERFLSDNALLSSGDKVYLTDSKKVVHVFDLQDGSLVRSAPFDEIYDEIKNIPPPPTSELKRYVAPLISGFPKLKGGADTYESLGKFIGMKAVDGNARGVERYKLYRFKLSSTIKNDGSLDVENLEIYDDLPRERILEFFKLNRFDRTHIPDIFEKWYLGDEYFDFRKADVRLARKEKRQEVIRQREELKKQLTLEIIDGVYIPKNLEECFIEMDKRLPEVDKQEMKALPKREDMIAYHLGVGMWMRNNWRLWAGSRLTTYFNSKGVFNPEDMSSVILYGYHDWLNGNKEAWKAWENNPK